MCDVVDGVGVVVVVVLLVTRLTLESVKSMTLINGLGCY